MSEKLKGKIAIVTGASKGIGAAIAKAMAREGASVIVNYSSSPEAAKQVVAEIERNKGKAVAVKANMANPEEIEKLFAETVKAFGKPHILVNNAGVYEFGKLENVTVESFHRMFNLNVLGLILASKEAVKLFGDSGGNIINISSLVSTKVVPAVLIYSATKAAVDSITRSLSAELGPKKIRVNAINPGLVETEGIAAVGFTQKDKEDRIKETPLGRLGKPDDIAKVAIFLASDDTDWMTGETIFVTGGRM